MKAQLFSLNLSFKTAGRIAAGALLSTFLISTDGFASGGLTAPPQGGARSGPESNVGQKDCDGSIDEILECVGAQLLIADRELNVAYQAQIKALDNDAKSSDKLTKREAIEIRARLVKAQRSWLAYRDAECRLESSAFIGGSNEAVLLQGCLLGMTRDRVQRLKAL